MAICIKGTLGLNGIIRSEALMGVYISDITEVISEDIFCMILLIGRSDIQLEN